MGSWDSLIALVEDAERLMQELLRQRYISARDLSGVSDACSEARRCFTEKVDYPRARYYVVRAFALGMHAWARSLGIRMSRARDQADTSQVSRIVDTIRQENGTAFVAALQQLRDLERAFSGSSGSSTLETTLKVLPDIDKL